jgi:phage I-like protein
LPTPTKALQLEAGLPIDVNHSTDFAAPTGGQSPASGWIDQLANRGGEIWGHVTWTELGKTALSKGPNGEPPQYRYISPVFEYSRDNKVTRLLRAGLTNNPNLYFTAICSRMDAMKKAQHAKVTEAAKTNRTQSPKHEISRRV